MEVSKYSGISTKSLTMQLNSLGGASRPSAAAAESIDGQIAEIKKELALRQTTAKASAVSSSNPTLAASVANSTAAKANLSTTGNGSQTNVTYSGSSTISYSNPRITYLQNEIIRLNGSAPNASARESYDKQIVVYTQELNTLMASETVQKTSPRALVSELNPVLAKYTITELQYMADELKARYAPAPDARKGFDNEMDIYIKEIAARNGKTYTAPVRTYPSLPSASYTYTPPTVVAIYSSPYGPTTVSPSQQNASPSGLPGMSGTATVDNRYNGVNMNYLLDTHNQLSKVVLTNPDTMYSSQLDAISAEILNRITAANNANGNNANANTNTNTTPNGRVDVSPAAGATADDTTPQLTRDYIQNIIAAKLSGAEVDSNGNPKINGASTAKIFNQNKSVLSSYGNKELAALYAGIGLNSNGEPLMAGASNDARLKYFQAMAALGKSSTGNINDGNPRSVMNAYLPYKDGTKYDYTKGKYLESYIEWDNELGRYVSAFATDSAQYYMQTVLAQTDEETGIRYTLIPGLLDSDGNPSKAYYAAFAGVVSKFATNNARCGDVVKVTWDDGTYDYMIVGDTKGTYELGHTFGYSDPDGSVPGQSNAIELIVDPLCKGTTYSVLAEQGSIGTWGLNYSSKLYGNTDLSKHWSQAFSNIEILDINILGSKVTDWYK